MLTCREVTELAGDHLDRESCTGAGLQVQLHLALCPPCRLFVHQLARTVELVRRVEGPAPDPETEGRLLKAFRAAAECQPQPLSEPLSVMPDAPDPSPSSGTPIPRG